MVMGFQNLKRHRVEGLTDKVITGSIIIYYAKTVEKKSKEEKKFPNEIGF